jgi:hypothetical protein
VQSFDDQQPMVIQALDASVGENVEAMTGVQSANGNCMMVRSVGDSTAVWEEQECAAGADMPTVCRQSQGDDDEGHTFVATYVASLSLSLPPPVCRQSQGDDDEATPSPLSLSLPPTSFPHSRRDTTRSSSRLPRAGSPPVGNPRNQYCKCT